MKRILAILAVVAGFISISAQSTISRPGFKRTDDFVYPQKVIAQSEKDLKKSLSDGNGQLTVGALIRYGIARTAISPDNYPEVVEKVEKVAAEVKSPATRALLNLLLSDLLLDYYQADSYDLDRRTTVAGQTDFTLWSGEQFKQRIAELLSEALSDSGPLLQTPLADYPEIITFDTNSLIFYPTLYDFAASHAISTLQSLSTSFRVLPTRFLTSLQLSAIPNTMPQINRQIVETADRWVNLRPEITPARIEALLWHTQALASMIVDSDTNLTFSQLMSQYNDNSYTPYAVELLLSMDYYGLQPDQLREYYQALNDFAKHNPDYFRLSAVKNRIKSITEPSVTITSPAQVGLHHSFPISLRCSNMPSSEVRILKVKSGCSKSNPSPDDCESQPYRVVPFTFAETAPFTAETSVPVTIDDYGRYIAVVAGLKDGRTGNPTINCSDISLLENNLGDDVTVWAVNPVTGAPQSDVTVTVKSSNVYKKSSTSTDYTTGTDGSVTFNPSSNNITISASKGSDTHSLPVSAWINDSSEKSDYYGAFIRTSLPIYHPGDTVEIAAVIYRYSAEGAQAVEGKPVTLTISNVNYEPVDTFSLVTDHYGRVTSRFTLPDEGLTGYYTATVNIEDERRTPGMLRFMVSDYKLPTYEVIAENATPSEDGVTLRGKALAYSGVPIADAEVTLSLDASVRSWWRMAPPVKFHEATARTDSDGEFTFEIPKSVLEASPYPSGTVTAVYTVTSPSGENRTASIGFALGSPYYIEMATGDCIVASSSTSLNLRLKEMGGNIIDDNFKLQFTSGGTTYDVTAVSADGITKADMSDIPSGTYSLQVASLGHEAEALKFAKVVVYRPGDVSSPVDAPLWVLNHRLEAAKGTGSVEATIATPRPGVYIQLTIASQGKIISRRWVESKGGVEKLPIEIPAGASSVSATLTAVCDLNCIREQITVNVADPAETVKVEVERLRDKVTPGAEETLKIRVTDGSGSGRQCAVIMDMYSKALDALESQSWNFNPTRLSYPTPISNTSLGNTRWFNFSASWKFARQIEITQPSFDLLGYQFTAPAGNSRRLFIRSNASRKMESSSSDEGFDGVAFATADNGAIEDMAVSQPAYRSDIEEEAVGDVTEKDFSYRPSEVPLAFFAPSLTTDADGNLSFTFTLPNANTTWVLNTLAFNPEMHTSLSVDEIIASKPLMVQPNLPRFLRRGDKAEIRATVFNSTDSVSAVTATMQLLDPSSSLAVASDTVTLIIAAKGSSTATFHIEAPMSMSALLVTTKASNGYYADGEQTLLPILPSQQEVIDSKTFYIAPSDHDFTLQLPEAGQNASRMLSFCDNPTWEVVAALPGLLSDDLHTSLSASAAIFAAAVSGYVIDATPGLEEALREWLASAKDEGTLLSKLNRNENLKQMVLASTPWVAEAGNDSRRLSRLALLFDRNNISRSIDSSCRILEKLQCDDGGWAWTSEYMESSPWMTLSILNNFAELRQLGCCPAKVDPMVEKALEYIDAEMVRQQTRHQSSDFTFYTYVRSLFPEVEQSEEAARISRTTVQKLVKGWAKESTVGKAVAALILFRNGYRNVASEVIKSLREYALTSPQLGMWWDSIGGKGYNWINRQAATAFILEAFATIDPDSADIDKIRQWLIINKTSQDWGTSVNCSACVAAILRCGSDWLHKPDMTIVAVDGVAIRHDVIDSLTGSFVAPVSTQSSTLTISRQTDNPAWGAVMTRSNQVMADILPASLPELSISKEILSPEGNAWVPSTNLSVGQVAKIRLVINASRDIDYVTVVDNRSATMEPVISTPRPVNCDGLTFYLENRDAATNLFIRHLPKGQYIVEYEMNVNNAGIFSSGIATLQSQYAPELTAHSGGRMIEVR